MLLTRVYNTITYIFTNALAFIMGAYWGADEPHSEMSGVAAMGLLNILTSMLDAHNRGEETDELIHNSTAFVIGAADAYVNDYANPLFSGFAFVGFIKLVKAGNTVREFFEADRQQAITNEENRVPVNGI